MRKILLFADWYEPGYKAGGPIRSCVNFTRYMRGEYELFVFTSDRDLGSTAPYENIRTDEWQKVAENLNLYYCSPAKLGWQVIREQMKAISPDFIYLNSMFSPHFTILPLLASRLGHYDHAIILAPRGMLKESALQFKSMKKKFFLKGLRWLGLHKNIHFHASDETEVKDTTRTFGSKVRITRIPNFPGAVPHNNGVLVKRPGELSLLFIGRIHPIKNLDYLLDILRQAGSRPEGSHPQGSLLGLTIVGSLEEVAYWEKCRGIIAALPPSVHVEYAGEIPNHELASVIEQHHIFVLPTQGENFGHAIFEALALGKPVLISDQTPWRNLEAAGAGWDLPLERPDLFLQAIEQAVGFGQEQYDERCGATRRFVRDYIDNLNLMDSYRQLFSRPK
jgi:glycosyltransferase involved in cell wall biosynthesis